MTDRKSLGFIIVALIAIGCFHGLVSAKTDVPNEVKKPIELNDANVESWREHIRPADSELAWRKIPWLPTLQQGILKATDEGRPVLLWTMNGHPLGCT